MNTAATETSSQIKVQNAINQAALLIEQGKASIAAEILENLLRDHGENLMARHLLGVCQRKSNHLDQAMQTQREILRLHPDFAAALQELGLSLRLAGKRSEAMAAFRHATEIDPRLVNSWKFLGDMAVQLGDEATAIHAYAQYPASSPHDPMLARALELIAGRKMGLADILIRSYLKRFPRDALALYEQSRIAVDFGAITEAMELLESVLAIEPLNFQARTDYINLLSRRQRYAEALTQVDWLLAAEPDHQSHQLLKASLLERCGKYQQAAEILRSILKVRPGQSAVWTGLAMLQRTMGQQPEAIISLHKAIDHEPERGEAWYQLADLKVFNFSDAQIAAMRGSLEHAEPHSENQIYFQFAIARALEGRGEFQEAFRFYAEGNRSRARTSAFKPEEYRRFIQAMINVCTPDLFRELEGSGCQDASPIFVVGLPRSGSTLVEQILTSHSQVDGTMELAHLATLVKELNFRQQKSRREVYPMAMADLESTDCATIGRTYIERSRILRGSRPFFVDKMPNNFEHIGLIQLALPKARIIDVRRDPMANGFSAFRQLFRAGQDWSYDLSHIGFYYGQYLELMKHWDRVLPGKVHHVSYEELVGEPETIIRGMLDFLALPFEAACLQPEKNPRAVRTASSEQVRQPVYDGALDFWKRYEAWLEPLRAALPQG